MRPATLPLVAVALVSGAGLLAQVALTRVLAIAQGYHFAFLVISLALLGFGASGSFLATASRLRERSLWPWYAVAFGLLTAGALLFLDAFPFDPFLVTREGTEVAKLVADLVALALPFFFVGLLIGAMLAEGAGDADPGTADPGAVYGASLLGSGLGAVLAPPVLDALGSERSVILSGLIGAAAGLALLARKAGPSLGRRRLVRIAISPAAAGALLVIVVLGVALGAGMEMHPSPYRRLAQVHLDPDARLLLTRQDARTRLDIIVSPTIRSAPGLSLSYTGPLPPQAGLILDADDLLTVPATDRASDALAASLPVSVAHRLRPGGRVLMLGSGGGTDAWAARQLGSSEVTVIEPDRLVFEALTTDLRSWAGLADDPAIDLVHAPIRTFVERDRGTYDVVELTLTDPYRPTSPGAISLTEDYRMTVEAFRAYLRRLAPEGLLVVTRWAQTRPTESLRTLGLILEALDPPDPRAHILGFRTFQTVTFIVGARPLTDQEVDAFLETIDELRYDLVLAPRIDEALLNRWARVPTLDEHERAIELASATDRSAVYATYHYEVAPPTDDRPFFFHFHRPEQAAAELEELGRRWLPFSGGGYFILVALLLFALAASALGIAAPLAVRRRFREALASRPRFSLRVLGYVVAIGLAFVFVEVTLVQRAILVLGDPTSAFALVVGALLVASGIGSMVSSRLPWRTAMVVLAGVLPVEVAFAPFTGARILALPDPLPTALLVAEVCAIGFLMGVPFPRMVGALPSGTMVAWAWAANGSASVVGGILASMASLSYGFGAVLASAAGLYLVAAALGGIRAARPVSRSSGP